MHSLLGFGVRSIPATRARAHELVAPFEAEMRRQIEAVGMDTAHDVPGPDRGPHQGPSTAAAPLFLVFVHSKSRVSTKVHVRAEAVRQHGTTHHRVAVNAGGQRGQVACVDGGPRTCRTRAPAWHTSHHLVVRECRWTALARWCGPRCLQAGTVWCGGWRQQKTRHHQLVAHGGLASWQVESCEMAGNGGCLCVLACGRQHPRYVWHVGQWLMLYRSPSPGAAGVSPGRGCWAGCPHGCSCTSCATVHVVLDGVAGFVLTRCVACLVLVPYPVDTSVHKYTGRSPVCWTTRQCDQSGVD